MLMYLSNCAKHLPTHLSLGFLSTLQRRQDLLRKLRQREVKPLGRDTVREEEFVAN
jgi:hypothetical protein